MKVLKLFFVGLLANICISSVAENIPETVQKTLKSLYPNIELIGWSTDSNYYVASFQDHGFNTKVWFNTEGHWKMKQTDWQVMDEVPEAIYHTFTFGPYSSDEVQDVTYIEFPQQAAIVIILIGEANASTQYQLFYHMNGELVNARNVTNMSNILGASTFL